MNTPTIRHAEGVIGRFIRQGTGIVSERQSCNAGWGQDVLLDSRTHRQSQPQGD
jgi:hypothetical protein